jgi:flagellar biosynthesis chaperone FliJ
MSTTPNVLMLAPDGSLGYVPSPNVEAAISNGGKVAVRMTAPDGSKGVIPFDNQDAAQKQGASWDVSPDNDATKAYMSWRQQAFANRPTDLLGRPANVPLTPPANLGTGPTISGNDQSAKLNSIPLAKKLFDAAEALDDAANFTEEGKAAHPIQAELGQVADRLKGFLFGGANPENSIGSGQYGMATNPITAGLMPGAEGEPAAAEAIKGVVNAGKSAYAGAKALVSDAGTVASDVSDAASTVRSLNPLKNPAPEVQQGFADIAKDAGGAESEIAPTAADPYGFRQVADEQVSRYKEAANKLDELSNNAFSDAQEAVNDSRDDFTAAGKQQYRQAVAKLNGIIDEHSAELADSGSDVGSMKADYAAAQANNKIASFLNKTTEEIGKDAPEAQAKLGPGLKEAILDLVQNQKGLLEKAGWTPEHINKAMQLARKMDTAQNVRTAAKWAAGTVPAAYGGYEAVKHLVPQH